MSGVGRRAKGVISLPGTMIRVLPLFREERLNSKIPGDNGVDLEHKETYGDRGGSDRPASGVSAE